MNHTDPECQSANAEQIGAHDLLFGKFSLLLISLAVLLTAASFSDGGTTSRILFCLLLSGILLVAAVTVCRRHHNLVPGLALAIPTVVMNWIVVFLEHQLAHVLHNVLVMIFFAFVSYHVLYAVLNDRRVTLDTIRGAVCVYVLVGIGWAYLYETLLSVDADSLRFPSSSAMVEESRNASLADTAYFSFVTLSTLGYGDMVPQTRPAKLATCFEAVFGQFYLAVLVARLVSLHLKSDD